MALSTWIEDLLVLDVETAIGPIVGLEPEALPFEMLRTTVAMTGDLEHRRSHTLVSGQRAVMMEKRHRQDQQAASVVRAQWGTLFRKLTQLNEMPPPVSFTIEED